MLDYLFFTINWVLLLIFGVILAISFAKLFYCNSVKLFQQGELTLYTILISAAFSLYIVAISSIHIYYAFINRQMFIDEPSLTLPLMFRAQETELTIELFLCFGVYLYAQSKIEKSLFFLKKKEAPYEMMLPKK